MRINVLLALDTRGQAVEMQDTLIEHDDLEDYRYIEQSKNR